MYHNRIAGGISSNRARSNRGSPAGGARTGSQAKVDAIDELQECPDHRPSSFEQGKL
jgi:hypothetical protein